MVLKSSCHVIWSLMTDWSKILIKKICDHLSFFPAQNYKICVLFCLFQCTYIQKWPDLVRNARCSVNEMWVMTERMILCIKKSHLVQASD